MSEKNLYYLHELSDYKVASDYPDVRGWEVRDVDNNKVGKVDNLLVNKKAERVVYLDVEVDEALKGNHESLSTPASAGVHDFVNKEGEDHLIVPVGMVQLDEENKCVKSNEITFDTFRSTKRYRKDAGVDQGYELVVYNQYVTSSDYDDTTTVDDDFYNRKEFQSNYKREKNT